MYRLTQCWFYFGKFRIISIYKLNIGYLKAKSVVTKINIFHVALYINLFFFFKYCLHRSAGKTKCKIPLVLEACTFVHNESTYVLAVYSTMTETSMKYKVWIPIGLVKLGGCTLQNDWLLFTCHVYCRVHHQMLSIMYPIQPGKDSYYWAIPDEFRTTPYGRHFWNWGWKRQPEFMSQQNPMEGTSGIGGENKNWQPELTNLLAIPAGIHKNINAFHRVVPELTDLLAIPAGNLKNVNAFHRAVPYPPTGIKAKMPAGNGTLISFPTGNVPFGHAFHRGGGAEFIWNSPFAHKMHAVFKEFFARESHKLISKHTKK